MERDGFDHLRYVDDMRIFCSSMHQARRALGRLIVLLREKGLHLQTAKSYIKTAEDARNEINDVAFAIDGINQELIAELSVEYGSPHEIRQIMESSHKQPHISTIHAAFDRYFCREPQLEFSKSLFHFVINRLAAAEDELAVDHCLQTLLERPEESRNILYDYFSCLPECKQSLCDHLSKYVLSGHIPYNYQIYLMTKWLYDHGTKTDSVLRAARHAAQRTMPEYVRNYGFAILGKWGDATDLREIESQYSTLGSEMSRTSAICALRRMTPMRRNAFYGRVQGEWFVDRAVKWARSS